MSRPTPARTASTNLSAGGSGRALEGKLAVVTGGSRGIGAATAELLASKGASVVINYTSASSEQKTTELATRLQDEFSIRALPVQADMGDPAGPAHLITTIKNHFSHPKTGKFQIDILIQNAGVAFNAGIEEDQLANFDKLFHVNVRGPLLLIGAVAPYLPSDRSGRIVNVSSVSSTCGFERQSIYAGTKAALEGMTKVWARELAEKATVNAVNPGPVATDMWDGVDEAFLKGINSWTVNTPLAGIREGVDQGKTLEQAKIMGGRPAYAEEIAGVIVMLCMKEAGWCTGSTVCANGGMKFTD
ncbi:Carbonyl reductase family member 4 [Sphaceloma murrayae]|uniref:Carbonyl reductase family member 4 n=1 Tax=Sphaceloma murrayae TaxID=2082308 RepID=A0A2K1QI61_9PEZI|nr:Carbonyl reductase family member 4 [Sphaceloma murrayae]